MRRAARVAKKSKRASGAPPFRRRSQPRRCLPARASSNVPPASPCPPSAPRRSGARRRPRTTPTSSGYFRSQRRGSPCPQGKYAAVKTLDSQGRGQHERAVFGDADDPALRNLLLGHGQSHLPALPGVTPRPFFAEKCKALARKSRKRPCEVFEQGCQKIGA